VWSWAVVVTVLALTVLAVVFAVTGSGSGGPAHTARAAAITPATSLGSALTPRQAIKIGSYTATRSGHTIVGLGLTNVSPLPATVLVSLKGQLPLTRSEVWLNLKQNPGEKFRNGTISVPLPANHTGEFWNLELILPTGSSGAVEIDLVGNFANEGTPSSTIADIAFHP
jgi:hypothetical protein